ncbi:MAG: hypothetical protein ACJASL_003863 [Paraglaciecola sp.]|jgi:hypothetical protein
MSLSDFATLAEAKAEPLIVDKLQVGSGQARGFFVNEGIWTILRQIQSDMGNPLFALADAVIVTASDASSFFGLDTATAEGVGNLAAAKVMVDAGIMTEAQKVKLLDLALKTTYPHANATQADFERAKGLMVYTPAIKQASGFIKLTSSADCESHRPKIFAVVQGINTQVGTAPEISKAGSYLARVPTNHASYIVENYYGVIS